MFATIGDSGSHINVFNVESFKNLIKIFSPNTQLKQLHFAPNGVELLASTHDCKIKVFGLNITSELQEAYLLREICSVHRDAICDFTISLNYKYLITVGKDKLVKVWDYEFALTGPGSN